MEETKSSTTLLYYNRRSRSKRQKRDEETQKDIISGLPDEVICYILSFLPTKYAVGTSILSKRWKFLWTSVPVLDLGEFDSKKSYREARNSPEHARLFMDFVDRVLILNTMQSIQKFNLYCGGCYHSSHVNSWIRAAIMRNIRELYLCSLTKEAVELPPSLFLCEKLVILRLCDQIILNAPESVCFPSLKVLHLYGLEHLDDSSVEKVLSGSPVLEELYIDRIYSNDMRILYVQSSSLKRLKIYAQNPNPYSYPDFDEYHDQLPYQNNHCKVVIDAPNLELFDLDDRVSEEFIMTNASLLVGARISVGPFWNNIHFDGYVDMVIQLLRHISNVKVLCLSGAAHMLRKAYEQHLLAFDKFPMFHNLTHLRLADGSKSEIIPDILKCTPNLQVFGLCVGVMWDLPESVPRCLLSSLKVVQFEMFHENDEEFKAAEYLLKNAKVLEKMLIDHAFIGDRSHVLKKLLMFPRASTLCQIAYQRTSFPGDYF